MTTPNYKPGVGQLATFRSDFQDHITGANFRHIASQIDLSPLAIIDGYTAYTVQDAINVLAITVSPPVIASATSSSQGIIQLSGDLSGTASTIRVSGLQTRPVSTLAPNIGDVLTWGGITWGPSAATNAFTAAGDLTGSNTLQNVVSLSGLGGTVQIFCNNLTFISSTSPNITQSSSIASAHNFNISAGSATGSGNNGGNLILSGGDCGSGGLRGGVVLKIANLTSSSYPLQAVEIVPGRRVLSLCHSAPVSSTDMPAASGDLVMYIRDAATAPAGGNPSNGTIVYSSGGQLWIQQADGNNFAVGSSPNPTIWGITGQQVYSYRSYVSSGIGMQSLAFTFALQDSTSTLINVTLVGKSVGTNDSAQYNLTMGYTRNSGGSPSAIGSIVNTDPRTTVGPTWTTPSISVSGNTLQVYTGASGSTVVQWLVITKLTMSQG